MQQQGHGLTRPTPLQQSQNNTDLQQLLELVRLGNLQNGGNRSAFSALGGTQPAPTLPEFSLFNNLQNSGLFHNQQQMQTDQLAQLHQWQQLQALQASLQNQAAAAAAPQTLGVHPPNLSAGIHPPNLSVFPSAAHPASSANSLSRGSRGDKSSNAYASRHQAAEQRRRTRINDRLDRLREVVPHSERANTATFLEEVISYVGGLKARVAALEKAQGLQPTQPATSQPAVQEAPAAGSSCPTCSQDGREQPSAPSQAPPQQQAPVSTSQAAPALVVTQSSPAPSSLPLAASGATQKEVPATPPQSGGKDAVNNPGACVCTAASHQRGAADSGDEGAPKRAKISAD